MITGKRILVVEDEPLVAMLLEDMLLELGAYVVGPVGQVRDALALLNGEPVDAAVLDVNLGQERSDAIAVKLEAIGTPFVFATGYGPDCLDRWNAEVIAKPYRLDQVSEVLTRALEGGQVRP